MYRKLKNMEKPNISRLTHPNDDSPNPSSILSETSIQILELISENVQKTTKDPEKLDSPKLTHPSDNSPNPSSQIPLFQPSSPVPSCLLMKYRIVV